MTKIDRLVDEMVTFTPTGNNGVMTLRAPLNPRTGMAKEISLVCEAHRVDAMKSWLRELLMTSGDAIADHFNLHVDIQFRHTGPPLLHADDVFEPILYAVERG